MKTFLRVWIGISLIAIGFGIGIIIIAMTTGFSSWKDIPTTSIEESYDNVKSLDFNIGYGKVNIEEGDTFSIKADNVPEEGFESYVTDGTWYITEGYDNMVDLFGWRFSLRQVFHWEDYYTPDITITVPADFTAQAYNLKVTAGEAVVSCVNAAEGNISVDSGLLTIDELNITGKSAYEVGAGELKIRDFAANDTKIECGIGYIDLDGTLTGANEIKCGIGSIDLRLDGNEDDYSYDISAGIGSVNIDGHHFHDRHVNNDTGNDLKFNCGIGSITVDFQ